MVQVTHQYSPRSGLTRYQLTGPVLGLGHEGALELLLPLADGLLFLLLRVIGRQLGLLSTADEREEPPQQHDDKADDEGEDTGQEEAEPLPLLETYLLRGQRWG